ncbi:MAG: bifunctional DNA-formamidopyrimidine glycosylase/DNA-(apurinic or apyrimidinic site) lyase [Rickettsiaceae bacterium]|nr:bifunctional DNA-formamidopyrimidine glycosylase/DNA-(apurinic or apyrimidinic site) lyase [Rickettsiaceae bacterium]
MPELAEVEVIKLSLNPIINCTILECNILQNKLRYRVPIDLAQKLSGKKIVKITRRSKYLLILLSNEYTVMIHLGMTGRVTLQNLDYNPIKHDHIIVVFDSFKLVYNDIRRFGYWLIVKKNELLKHSLISILGPEPLEEEFSAAYLTRKLTKLKTNIKAALMNSKIVVGVGNIYANEALHRCKISPLRIASKLSAVELENLVKAIKSVLMESIKLGGSSISNYVNSIGQKGGFQNQFLVYARSGNLCSYKCGNKIIRIRQNQRSSFYCSVCQI